MATFPLEIETLEFPDDTTVNGLFVADVVTDSEGTFFGLESLTVDGKTIYEGEWRWGCMLAWIALNAVRKFSPLHEALIASRSPDARAAAYADHVRSQRAA